MKKYILINPATNKPSEFSFNKESDRIYGETYTNDDGITAVRYHSPIVLEVNEINDCLLKKVYNPETGTLEDA